MNRVRWGGVALVVAASIVSEWLIPHDVEYASHWWNAIPGFFALFGVLGCVAIIIFAKLIGKLVLLKKEDYYDAG